MTAPPYWRAAGAGEGVRAARKGDAARLAPALRAADRAEMAALGLEPEQALADSVAASVRAFAIELDGTGVAALFGVGRHPDAPEVGAPWLMASDAILRRKTAFLRASRAWTEALGEGFDLLVNRVDARNAAHIAWLRFCGFTMLRVAPAGPLGLPFIEFARLVRA